MRNFLKAATTAAAFAVLATAAVAGDTAYKYDALGRVLLSTYPDNSQVGFKYDNSGNRVSTRRAKIVGPTTSDRLTAGQGLVPGASITSPNGCYKLTLQEDGNAVLTRLGVAKWSSNSSGAPSANLAVQSDGNVVLNGPVGEVLWHASTGGHAGAFMVIQNDGNLVIYQGATAYWNSGTSLGAC